ncbi:MAG: ABC transporter permease [Christensenellales bacterium]|jgi:multidrug/hemolysin transport system permease protein
MTALLKRNLWIFFRDKSSVFFSLLSVFIIIGLYALFLGDVWTQGFSELGNARPLMDHWIMSGLLAVTSITTTMGAFGIMVEDRSKLLTKDFYSSPLKRNVLAGSYIMTAFVVGVIMSVVALVVMEIYLVAMGNALLSFVTFLKVFGLILLSTLASTSMVLLLVSFLKSLNAFSTASAILGTMIGFVTGIYMPIDILPGAVQHIVRAFPISHAATLFRQVIMEAPLQQVFAGAPAGTSASFEKMMGVTLYVGDTIITPLVSILILIVTAVLFYCLAAFNLSRKRKS